MVKIYDPDLYVDGPINEIFAELRRTQPVYWQDMPDEPGYWAVLKHADLSEVARKTRALLGGAAGRRPREPRAGTARADPQHAVDDGSAAHTSYSRPLADTFKARVIGQMEERVRRICDEILAAVVDRGEVEFVHEVAAKLPNQVVGELVGIPREDWEQISVWAEQSTSSQDPELGTGYQQTGLSDMALYAVEFAAPAGEPSRPARTWPHSYSQVTSVTGRCRRSSSAAFRPTRHCGQRHHQNDAGGGSALVADEPRTAGAPPQRHEPPTDRSRGDPAIRQPPPLLPSNGDSCYHVARCGHQSW